MKFGLRYASERAARRAEAAVQITLPGAGVRAVQPLGVNPLETREISAWVLYGHYEFTDAGARETFADAVERVQDTSEDGSYVYRWTDYSGEQDIAERDRRSLVERIIASVVGPL